MEISVTVEVPMGHRLPAHLGLCRNYHGHNYSITPIVQGTIDPATGMVMDFHDIKAAMKEVFARFDHTMVLQEGDPLCSTLNDMMSRYLVLDLPPTAEVLASLWRRMLKAKGLDVIRIHVKETSNTLATCNGSGPYVAIVGGNV